jgi:hypothetical protein
LFSRLGLFLITKGGEEGIRRLGEERSEEGFWVYRGMLKFKTWIKMEEVLL